LVGLDPPSLEVGSSLDEAEESAFLTGRAVEARSLINRRRTKSNFIWGKVGCCLGKEGTRIFIRIGAYGLVVSSKDKYFPVF
jgi:hypothetical protein